MKSSTAALVAAALAGLTGGVGPAAPAAAQDDDLIQVRACNNSGRNALAAVSFIEPGRDDFVTRGWYDVPAGQCVDLVKTDNANFYLYADAMDGSNRFWGGSKTLCVQYPGPFTYYHDGSSYCPQGMDTREFIQGVQNEAGVYTFNLGN